MRLAGKRLTKDGVIVIIAQDHRAQERNRAEARERLVALIRQAAVKPMPRRADQGARRRRSAKRLEGKKAPRGSIKTACGSGKPSFDYAE